MNLWRCRGCEAKDREISRLTYANAELLNRVLALSGQPPLAPQPGTATDDGPVTEREIAKTLEEMDKEAEEFVARHAEKRGMTPGEFADA